MSVHVVVLIKDFNGNHVIQKHLNKLVPEDNEVRYPFSFTALMLIDAYSNYMMLSRQNVVNEITYNALTLVQDTYGNYVHSCSLPSMRRLMFSVSGRPIYSRPC